MRNSRLVVMLPAYNEEDGLGKLLQRMSDALGGQATHLEATDSGPGPVRPNCGLTVTVLVVDDGSTDGTVAVAKAAAPGLDVRVVSHGVNQGLGAAVRTGFREALALASGPEDMITTLDADDTHNPHLIRRMIQLVDEGNDVVIASRYQVGSSIRGLSPMRRFTGWAASWLFRLAFPIGVRDFTCGFRTYRAEALRRAMDRYGDRLLAEEGFACMADILVKLGLMGAVCAEVPMVLRYDQKKGASKMRVGATVLRSLKLIVERRLGQF